MNTVPLQLKVWGDFACFTEPSMRVERVSYPVMTPSAARGILESVFWKPQIRFEIDRIAVLRPIQFVSVRRNEIQDTIEQGAVKRWAENPSSFRPYFVDRTENDGSDAGKKKGKNNRAQRNSVLLRDVAYIIQARLSVLKPTAEDNPRKYEEMFTRRAASGQCFRQPSLGIREFAAHFALPDGTETPVSDSRDLGIMLYDLDYGSAVARGLYPKKQALFAPARLEAGFLDVTAMRANLFQRVTP